MKKGLQFSGGKDSVACLYLLQSMWDDITVYWCNSGNQFPEAILYMEFMKQEVPHFVEVQSNQPQVIQMYGLPKPEEKVRCCGTVLWLPLHERMKQDGIEIIIRGQKLCDELKSPIRSGDFADGFGFWFPIEDWTDEQVWDYIYKNKLPVMPFYDHANGTLECMNCTAYPELGHENYLAHRS